MQPLIRIEADLIRAFRRRDESEKKRFMNQQGRRLPFDEIISRPLEPQKQITGALYLAYSPNSFLTVDRIINDRQNNNFKRSRRIINYLNSRTGQIGSAVLIELLKIENGAEFSKHKLIPTIDKVFFNGRGISAGEINEAISRMFRKTMNDFFAVEGKRFVRKNFVVGIKNLPTNEYYPLVKPNIDQSVNQFIYMLKKN